jgi:hypothetical protein
VTKQISDSLLFKGETYSVVWGTPMFFREVWDLDPVPISTACYRGYHCTYHVDDHLWLAELEVGLEGEYEQDAKAGIGPLIFGALPEPHYYEYQRWDELAGKFVDGGVAQSGSWLYRPRKLMSEVKHVQISKRMWDSGAWFDTPEPTPVFDLLFDQGKLIHVTDATEAVYLERLHEQERRERELNERIVEGWRREDAAKRKAEREAFRKKWGWLLFWKK